MFWTHWVRGVAKLLLALMVIASLISGVMIVGFLGEDLIWLGAVVALGGILFSITVVSIVMMLSEISVNIHKLNKAISGENISYNKSDDSSSFAEMKHSAQPPDFWACSCGTHNAVKAKFCRSCGKAKE